MITSSAFLSLASFAIYFAKVSGDTFLTFLVLTFIS